MKQLAMQQKMPTNGSEQKSGQYQSDMFNFGIDDPQKQIISRPMLTKHQQNVNQKATRGLCSTKLVNPYFSQNFSIELKQVSCFLLPQLCSTCGDVLQTFKLSKLVISVLERHSLSFSKLLHSNHLFNVWTFAFRHQRPHLIIIWQQYSLLGLLLC